MKDFSIELFNQDDEKEFKKFYKKQHDSTLQMIQEVVKDERESDKITKECFEIIRIKKNKSYKSYEDIIKDLATTANNKLVEYKQYQRMRPDL